MVPYTILTDRAKKAYNGEKCPIFQWCENISLNVASSKHVKKAIHDMSCNLFYLRPSFSYELLNRSSANCFLARFCLVCTIFWYITLCSTRQRHKLELKRAYLKCLIWRAWSNKQVCKFIHNIDQLMENKIYLPFQHNWDSSQTGRAWNYNQNVLPLL